MKWPVCSIGDHLIIQNFCPRVRKICAILDTHQDIIGHDPPVRSRILPNYNEHGAFGGHEKENVINKVSDPPFTNLVQKVIATKNPCSLDDFLVAELYTKRRITAL